MDLDLLNTKSAYEFALWMTDLRADEFTMEYIVNCNRDFDVFWNTIKDRTIDIDVNDIKIVAFHVLGSLDNCSEIKEYGLHNLQYVLSENTVLNRLLKENGIEFDIANRIMVCDNVKYNIDYDHYKNLRFKNKMDKQLESIAHRIYYDFCVNGFLVCDDVKRYGTDIHERPEFLQTLLEISQNGIDVDCYWRNNHTSYIVTFFAYIDQIHKFQFNLEDNNFEYTEDELWTIKRWMLSLAIDRAYDELNEEYLYIRDNMYIPPEQIIKIEELE